MSHADKDERPVVGALSVAVTDDLDDGNGGHVVQTGPNVYTWDEDGHRFMQPDKVPEGLVRVDATGAACLLVHRNVFEAVDADFGPHWFDPLPKARQPMGEDIAFFWRLMYMGVPVHVDTALTTTHHKSVWLQA